ncbi:LpxI family protein [Pontiella agarivorans]|uniref:UDP-2,3-diacylglucosamine diphosphatase LpxI n=1 Tax=Pontiella agarivorans TaxID=3038953 RepID=A0ABU5MW37_9BACT|nr:UDP-2,3-diacylglucosamine diphosphatase LpxI [Pontiella agarivorans]MDZ8118337.1 UDP-2,3-diacylglucosamine diphosphatase LpxI [Pontiella agarivorans]
MNEVPESLIIVAGRDAYPLMLVRAARDAGVKRIEVLAFKGETRREIAAMADKMHWVNLGSMQRFLDTLASIGIPKCMMVGQIAPKNLFTVRMDKLALEMYRKLDFKNAHTIFGAVVEAVENLGIEILPGNTFMECYTPKKGLLSKRAPTEREQADIELGLKLVKGTSDFEIGQTVALKEGMIVAVEAFEGTNQCIKRAGRVGKAGCVVVKVPKVGHDMRFDIPVVGTKTFKIMKRARVSCLAVEAGKTILLEQEKLIQLADQFDMAFVAVDTRFSTAENAETQRT